MAILAQLKAAGVRLEALPDGKLRAVGDLTDATRALIRMHKPEILAELAAANDHAQPATPAQAAELHALISVILADESDDSDADKAEALTVALADPDAALLSFRALAAPLQMPAVEQRDDRRRCTDCANLSGDHRCLAAWRGEQLGFGHGRNYHPTANLPLRCIGYQPKAGEADQRTGAQRWPSLTRAKQ